ncbi:MAG: rhomboid family intramembrane serine protease [Chloroflexota bacterium]
MPLSDRDYMRNPPPRWRPGGYRGRRSWNFGLSPVWVLIIINFLFLVATTISRDVLLNLGLIPAAFSQRPWTLITAMFVHAGFGHIFGNMLTLFFFGRFLSRLVGDKKFLLVYFVGGIVGNLLYLLLGNPLSIAVGASGAVYAIAGTLVVLTPNVRVLLWFFIPMPLWVVVVVFFLLWSFIPGVAWQAHLGGLLVGAVAGYFFRRRGGY